MEEAKQSRRMWMIGACQVSAGEHVGFGLEGSSASARDLTWILPGASRSQALRHESQRLGLAFLIHSWANGLDWGCSGAHSTSCRAINDVQDLIECALLQMRFPGRMCCALKSVLLQQDNRWGRDSWNEAGYCASTALSCGRAWDRTLVGSAYPSQLQVIGS